MEKFSKFLLSFIAIIINIIFVDVFLIKKINLNFKIKLENKILNILH